MWGDWGYLNSSATGPLLGWIQLGVFFSHTSATSGLSFLESSVIASSGQAVLHTPHPKHLRGSIRTLERADE